ncbi:MAG: DNA polymerase I, partial [Candidatus Limnocylindrales bacterium]
SLVERLPPLRGEAPLAPGDRLREADAAGAVPAAVVPGRSPSTRGEGSGLQLTLDFDALGGPAPLMAPAAAEPEDGPPATAVVALPADPRSRLEHTLADPGHVERLAADEDPSAWLAAQERLTVGLAVDDPRPRRGILLGLAVAGPDGRLLTADAATAPRLLALVVAAGRPLDGHDVKRVMVAELARRDPAGHDRVGAGGSLPEAGFDTQIAAYILNAALRSQALADVVAERLAIELPKPGTLNGPEHAAVEAAAVAAARAVLLPELEAAGLERLYRELELPLIPVLAEMEAVGVAVDRAALAGLAASFATEIGRLETEIYAAVGHEFNLGSPKQLEQVLFYELDLPRGRRTKTGYSTDATVLEELRPAHPAIGLLLDWRVYTKLKSTYVDALPLMLDPLTGRLHTTFHQAVAATGRLSSSDPNLQNIPIRTDLGRSIRRTFVAGAPGTTLLAADYSQIELRVLAHVSGDAALRDAFARHADVHRETAALVLHKAPADITPDERSMAKMVNFGIAYGMSDFGLSSRANIPRAEAQEFISRYFATYSGISYYMLHIKDQARSQGYVTTLLGRRRSIPELQQRNPNLRAAGERMAINMPIQGTAADIMKIAMIRLRERLRRDGSAARLLLQVHDELVLEVPRDEVPSLAPLVRETMATAMPLDVPLDVDVKVGDDWERMTPIPEKA